MHQQIDRAKVKQGRKDRNQHDLDIGHLGKFAHQEGPRPHERRHDLPTRRGRSLDPASLGGTVAKFFHQRDGKGPRRDHICNRRARDRAHAGACNNRRLGRTTGLFARRGIGQIDKEFTSAGDFQKGTKQHKDKNEGCRNAQGDTKDPFGTQCHLAGQPFK